MYDDELIEEAFIDTSVWITVFRDRQGRTSGERTDLQAQDYIETTPHTWVAAARIYYDLQRQGLTVRSSIDCCIAQLTIDAQLTLIHNDRDFEAIQTVRSFNALQFQPDGH